MYDFSIKASKYRLCFKKLSINIKVYKLTWSKYHDIYTPTTYDDKLAVPTYKNNT